MNLATNFTHWKPDDLGHIWYICTYGVRDRVRMVGGLFAHRLFGLTRLGWFGKTPEIQLLILAKLNSQDFLCAKPLRERADEALLGRGVHDGEGDFLERSRELAGERSMEKLRHEVSIITEGTAAPRSQD